MFGVHILEKKDDSLGIVLILYQVEVMNRH